jgi:hypothetical protein
MEIIKTIIAFFLISCFFSEGNCEDNISVSGNPPVLRIEFAEAGDRPQNVRDSSTTYSLKIKSDRKNRKNDENKSSSKRKIVGRLGSNMPKKTKLKVKLQSLKNANSQGFVMVDAINRDLVTNISIGNHNNLGITYNFSSRIEAGKIAMTSKFLTLTIVEQ